MAEKKKRNYNPKCRDNLKQYQAVKVKKQKEDITKEILEDIDVDIDEDLLDLIIPAKDIFSGNEQERFAKYVKEYLKEYSGRGADLTISDMDDIAQLCMNNIMITRLLKEAKAPDRSVADVMAAVEKLKKDNKTLKDNLGSARKDRVDPRANQTLTVSEIIGEYEQERSKRRAKLAEYTQEEEEVKDLCHTSVDDMIK